MASLTFYGATRQVTGSCFLLEDRGHRLLLDCGLYQGGNEADIAYHEDFPFLPAEIDAVVLSHAHLDHSGLLPKLVNQGFTGPVYLTPATCDLLRLMLEDAAHLENKDTEWENRQRLRSGQKPIEPLFTLLDVDAVLKQCRPIEYQRQEQILPGIAVKFRDAGHILGSAIVELQLMEHENTKRLLFSGDLGNSCSALLRDPEQAMALIFCCWNQPMATAVIAVSKPRCRRSRIFWPAPTNRVEMCLFLCLRGGAHPGAALLAWQV